MGRLYRVFTQSHLPCSMKVFEPTVVGEPGVRDTGAPCEMFQYGPPTGDCETDGHYMCAECKHLDLKSEYADYHEVSRRVACRVEVVPPEGSVAQTPE